MLKENKLIGFLPNCFDEKDNFEKYFQFEEDIFVVRLNSNKNKNALFAQTVVSSQRFDFCLKGVFKGF